MILQLNNLVLPFDHSEDELNNRVLKLLQIDCGLLLSLKIQRSSLDSRRGRPIRRVYSVLIEVRDDWDWDPLIQMLPNLSRWKPHSYQLPSSSGQRTLTRPIVVGSGPAGIFASLVLAEAGLEPLILERGEPVEIRTKHVGQFWAEGILNPESNVQFGEGGAGTFSDGKLGSRIKDKSGRREKILQTLVDAGAPPQILIDAKPHVGTANLAKVVRNLRLRITDLGGEYRFGAMVQDLIVDGCKLTGLVLASGERISSSAVILAVGHSARDTFEMLNARDIQLEAKPFSVGFRVEHPQGMIDLSQYGEQAGHPALPAADYQLSFHSSERRTVYSFCMCPGGFVIGAASEQNRVVTNGMSQFERNGLNANSALVVEVFPGDFSDEPLGGIALQRRWEKIAFELGGGNYHAPVQLVGDFLSGKPSNSLGQVSPTYRPGVTPVDLRVIYPAFVSRAVEEALPQFDRKIRGFARNDAVLTGVETRTSCPLRIVRGKDFQSVSLRGLYPAGEGSGYAGGIMSSAIDGMKAAEMIIQSVNRQ